ncbi:MAG: hypothetical protein H7A46_08440 [Verrucomicrobiales bacterium]|nr:hypothetical protein [Verrucomicrobiales bacterium]
MPWLKKNLTLVVAGLVALLLLGGSGYFLYTKMNRAGAVQAELNAQRTKLEQLSNQRPHPGNAKVDNVKNAKDQTEELKAQLAEFKQTFAPFDLSTNLSSGDFKSRLLETLEELERGALRSGIKLGSNFAFGFAGIKNKFSFEPEELAVHIEQLAHVQAIGQALIDARVLTIDSIKRPALPKKEEAAATTTGFGRSPAPAPAATTTTATEELSQDHWKREPETTDVAVLYPYEVTFQAFTPELGRFLDALARGPHCIVPKNIAVDTASSSLLTTPMSPYQMYGMGGGAAAAFGGGGGGMDPGMAARYGMGRGEGGMDPGMAARYGMGAGAGMPGMSFGGRGPVMRGGKTILLEEHPFRVRAWLYVVVPLAEPETADTATPVANPMAPGPMGSRY